MDLLEWYKYSCYFSAQKATRISVKGRTTCPHVFTAVQQVMARVPEARTRFMNILRTIHVAYIAVQQAMARVPEVLSRFTSMAMEMENVSGAGARR